MFPLNTIVTKITNSIKTGLTQYKAFTFKQKRAVHFPFIIFLFFLIYYTTWHIVLLALSSTTTIEHIRNEFIILVNIYILISIFITMFINSVNYYINKKKIKIAINILIFITFVFFTIIRIVDWGTVYFSGQHMNTEFWYHAFYIDGTYFLKAHESTRLLIVGFVFVFIFSFILVKVLRFISRIKTSGIHFFRPGIIVNSFSIFFVFLITNLILFSFGHTKKADSTFTKIPDYTAISSFYDYISVDDTNPNITLNNKTIEKLKQFGIQLNTYDANYPLMKKSIYINNNGKTTNKPILTDKTNLIIVFVESLNKSFLEVEKHNIQGLTPSFHDLMKRGISFNKMINANAPTIRGIIAGLGSYIYNIEKLQGLKTGKKNSLRPPIPTNFLFLSDILKKHGYYNIHIQGGSGNFAGTKNAFLTNEHYDEFYGKRSSELYNFAKKNIVKGNSTWGLWDEDIFNFAVDKLKNNKIQSPFLLSISTLDLHVPYKAHYKNKNTNGNNLLNCVYSTDKAFGILWNYIKNSHYHKNTAVIVIADHISQNNNYIEKFNTKYNFPQNDKYCGYIAAMMYVPNNKNFTGIKNNTFCSNLDLTPTILDMMNIDVPNPFLGLSIFSERKQYPLPLTKYNLTGINSIYDEMPDYAKSYMKKTDWSADDQNNFLQFIKSLTSKRKIYTELPSV